MTTNKMQLKGDYLSGRYTNKQLSDRHGASVDAIKQMATRHGWVAEKRAVQASADTLSRHAIAQDIVAERKQHNAAFAEVGRLMRETLAARLQRALEGAEALSPKELLTLAKVAEASQRVGRIALNMDHALYASPFGRTRDEWDDGPGLDDEEMARLLAEVG